MKTGRFFWKLFLGNAALMGLVLGTAVVFILSRLDRLQSESLAEYLSAQARALALGTGESFDVEPGGGLDRLAKAISAGREDGLRVTFVAADGRVLGDSHVDPLEMEFHADRPEIREAMTNGEGRGTRWSHTLARNLHYAACRVTSGGVTVGVARVGVPVRSIGAKLAVERKVILTISVAVLVAAVGLALGLAQLWSRRIQRIRDAARSLSRRDLSSRIHVSGSDEVADLARSLNQMRDDIAFQLSTIDRQRLTLQSLLAQLHEGVILASRKGDLVVVNPEAARLLRMVSPRPDGSFDGLPAEICIPQHEIQQLLRGEPGAVGDPGWSESDESSGTWASPREDGPAAFRDTVELKVSLEGSNGPVSLLARAFNIAYPDAAPPSGVGGGNSPTGRLVVLTDVTKLAETMQIKADFSANASHELRTPLSAIRVAVDTLRSLDPAGNGAAFRHFLDVIDRQSGRMEAMVADLLDLSRVESPTAHFTPTRVTSRELVEEIQTNFADDLAEKQLHWEVRIEPEARSLVVGVDLLRIVLRNLVENAIRFTPPGGRVGVTFDARDGNHVVCVTDTGCGIPPSEQSRVFERFYQVERARSGPNRGTGLGLSIVRHAVVAMQGSVRLESEVGKGTRVEVTFPARTSLSRRSFAGSAKES